MYLLSHSDHLSYFLCLQNLLYFIYIKTAIVDLSYVPNTAGILFYVRILSFIITLYIYLLCCIYVVSIMSLLAQNYKYIFALLRFCLIRGRSTDSSCHILALNFIISLSISYIAITTCSALYHLLSCNTSTWGLACGAPSNTS